MGIIGETDMENIYSNRGGWFGAPLNSTGMPLTGIQKFIAAESLLSEETEGTGVFVYEMHRFRSRLANESIFSNPIRIYAIPIESPRSPAENIAQIRKIIAPAMSDLAKSFNVSRQTIYNWLKGEQPANEHISKLRDLALAADAFAEAGISVNGILLKRKVIQGKNLFEAIRDGGSALDTAPLPV